MADYISEGHTEANRLRMVVTDYTNGPWFIKAARFATINLPLRLPMDELVDFVDSQQIRCSHYGRFSFLYRPGPTFESPAARGRQSFATGTEWLYSRQYGRVQMGL